MNTQMIKRKLAKGLTTGIGVFGSSFIGNTLEDQLPFSGYGVGVGQMALGAGIAVGSEKLGGVVGGRTGARDSLVETGIEHVGYGIHGAGFAEVADQLQTGARAERMVNVRARRDDAQQRAASDTGSASMGDSYSLDTA
jgi:hypothetical protein